MELSSPRFKLVLCDFKKVVVGMLIAAAGAALTYLQDAIPAIDFGQYALFAVALNTMIVNTCRKLLAAKVSGQPFDKEQLKKLAIGTAVGLAGVVATYFQGAAEHLDLGTYGPMLVAINSTFLNLGRLWIAEHGKLI